MEKEILKIVIENWERFVDYKKEQGDFRDDDDYSFGEFIKWLN